MGTIRRLTACRLCGQRALRRIIDLGEVPLGNNLQETRSAALSAAQYPLELWRCSECGHFQLGHAVSGDILYATNYTYLSGVGPSFIRHFNEYADWIARRCELTGQALVVDVGSNDGTCLKPFMRKGHRVLGVDPASLPAKIANDNGIKTINGFFDRSVVERIIASDGRADLVTSHNVLAHVDDLAATFKNIYELVKDDGFFCFEVGYFREILTNDYFDTIYHEHLDYHHAAPLVRHLTSLGFNIESIDVVPVQGGSIRVLCKKTGRGEISPLAQAFLAAERVSIVNDERYLEGWEGRIKSKMFRLRDAVKDRAQSGLLIAGYGAPTKATLLMKMAQIGASEIDHVVEDNALKTGRFLPGTGIPILPAPHLYDQTPDVLIFFAWNFAEDIVGRIGGKLGKRVEGIIPLPEIRSVQL